MLGQETEARVIILLGTYNGSKYIKEQLDSLAAQTHPNWSLIVSDDGSTDATLEIVRRFAQTVAQKVTIVDGPRKGFCRNFLSLIELADSAQGDFFAFCDQDDIWLPEKLERALLWFKNVQTQKPAIYCARTELIDQAGARIGFSPLFRRQPSFRNALVQSIAGGNTMVINKQARDLLARTAPQADLVSHDWWAYQLVTGVGGQVFYDSVPSIKYRQHTSNIIGSNKGPVARIARLRAFMGGQWKRWNTTNIIALKTIRDLLLPSAMTAFDNFSAARQGNLRLLWRSRVYRQSAIDTIAMYVGAVFQLI